MSSQLPSIYPTSGSNQIVTTAISPGQPSDVFNQLVKLVTDVINYEWVIIKISFGSHIEAKLEAHAPSEKRPFYHVIITTGAIFMDDLIGTSIDISHTTWSIVYTGTDSFTFRRTNVADHIGLKIDGKPVQSNWTQNALPLSSNPQSMSFMLNNKEVVFYADQSVSNKQGRKPGVTFKNDPPQRASRSQFNHPSQTSYNSMPGQMQKMSGPPLSERQHHNNPPMSAPSSMSQANMGQSMNMPTDNTSGFMPTMGGSGDLYNMGGGPPGFSYVSNPQDQLIPNFTQMKFN